MPLTGITLNWYELIALLVIVPTTITIPLTIWLTKIKLAVDTAHKCIQRLENQMDHNIESSKQAIQNTEKLFLSLTSEIKSLSISIGILGDKVSTNERTAIELKQEEKDIRAFFTEWIQRVEDLLREQRSGSMNVKTPEVSKIESIIKEDPNISKRLDLIEKILMKMVDRNENYET